MALISQKELFDKTCERIIIMHDRYIIRELPKGKRKFIDTSHTDYTFKSSPYMKFDYHDKYFYMDVFIYNVRTNEEFRLARVQTNDDSYDVDGVMELLPTFAETARAVIEKHYRDNANSSINEDAGEAA